MGLQVTASKAALLLQCPRPFEDETEIELGSPREAALYGTRFHYYMAQRAAADAGIEWTTKGNLDAELEEHVQGAYATLRAWMAPDGNPFGLQFHVVGVEVSRAMTFPYGHVKAKLHDPDGEHRYVPHDGEEADIYGTADLILEASPGNHPGMRVVLDHKTGADRSNSYISPIEVEQMQALGLMFDADALAILHAPKDAPAVVYAEEFSDRRQVRQLLQAAVDRIGSGFLRPGPECKYCPARSTCPTTTTETLVRVEQVVGRVTPADIIAPSNLGRYHLFAADVERLLKVGRAALKSKVKDGEVITRPDGKTLEIQSYDEERLSKEDIRAALGFEAAEKLFEELRSKGALVKKPVEKLVAK